ncbi:MAG TPA: nucleotide sugar dehydrogenase [Stellaceae bacterium]|nr:nucleotide sugar dehydrogenase [Stellaceae bacterium]
MSADSNAAHGRRIAVVGLGYVGLPVAAAFARAGTPVIAFDISDERVAELRGGHDRTREVEPEDLRAADLRFTADPGDLRAADFFIVTVPTPIDEAHRPDLRALLAASRTVGAALKKGDIVVYESTVYPGATEEDCAPLLEAASGLVCGRDFTLGYSPERINPGDREHRFEVIDKVVAGQDARTLGIVARVYGSVVTAKIHKAATIKTAEAAKVIENTQRDLNIALMNEFSSIFQELKIDTADVLAAAGTKWNFLKFSPGLVGGHCIGVDPYYLTHRAEKAGYHPQLILAARQVNDSVGGRVARQCVRMMLRHDGAKGPVTILGLTFKEDVPDIRNSKVVDIIRELEEFGVGVQVHDPMASPEEALREYGVRLLPREALESAEVVIFAVAHQEFVAEGWKLMTGLLRNGTGVVLDVKSRLPRAEQPDGIELWRL